METSIKEQINDELKRAKSKHSWDGHDEVYMTAIMLEEAGETMRAALQYKLEKGTIKALHDEAIQTAAMCIRLLEIICDKPKQEFKVGDVVGRFGDPTRYHVIEVYGYDWQASEWIYVIRNEKYLNDNRFSNERTFEQNITRFNDSQTQLHNDKSPS